MSITIMLVVLPIIAMFWFLNLITLLKNIKDGEFINNRLSWGAFLTLSFVFLFMFAIVSIH
jgi:hypothetical protein